MHIYTRTDIIELVKCRDPAYFIEQYCFVQHPTKGVVRMVLTDQQREWIRSAANGKNVALGEDRQNGKTQFLAMYALHKSVFIDDQRTAVWAAKYLWSQEIRQRIQFTISYLPEFLKPGIEYDNRNMMSFNNGSKIYFGAITESSGRGMSINTMLLDGWEYVKPAIATAFVHAFYPCLVGSNGIVISTGNKTPWQE